MYEINLIPGYDRKTRLERIYKNFIWVGVLVLLMVSFLGIWIPHEGLKKLKEKKGLKELEINRVSSNLKKNAFPGGLINSSQDNMRLSISEVSSLLEKERDAGTKYIEGLAKYLSGGVRIDNIKLNSGEIIINGNSSDYYSIVQYAAKLEKDTKYKSARIIQILLNDGTLDYYFIIKLLPGSE